METERSKEQYRECMRNHAASLGTYATDGCGEYTPDPSSPGGLRCAACGCHRNFHRKYVAFGLGGGSGGGLPSPASSDDRGTEGKRRTRTKFSEEQKEQMLQFAERIGWKIQRREGGGSAARGDDEVARFCREIGVSRQVFKVWMHNHKNSSVSSSSTTITTITPTAINKGSPSSLIH
ncbi:hypothetical protein Taro_031396 [Colocasia esculenta]|uniref:ZF-HD dimerization-type domain-containing protein n=1 Tax=Colocasia esculenta TaxID=4460 RepID=A0A843VPW8_COLES|nr:hypothetical protein [Colocasia esculenta]